MGSARLSFHLNLMGSSSRLQERHRSLRLRRGERRAGGRRRAADAGRPDPVGKWRGREVGQSGGRGGAPQGRARRTIPGPFQRGCFKPAACVAALRGPRQAGGGPLQGGTLPLGETTFREQPGTERPPEGRGGAGALFQETSGFFLVFQSESGSCKAASQSCSDPGQLPDDPDGRSPERKSRCPLGKSRSVPESNGADVSSQLQRVRTSERWSSPKSLTILWALA